MMASAAMDWPTAITVCVCTACFTAFCAFLVWMMGRD